VHLLPHSTHCTRTECGWGVRILLLGSRGIAQNIPWCSVYDPCRLRYWNGSGGIRRSVRKSCSSRHNAFRFRCVCWALRVKWSIATFRALLLFRLCSARIQA
jgi:hypothetical protein